MAHARSEELDAEQLIARIDPVSAQATLGEDVVRTPTLASADLSERFGAPVLLKAECLQLTGAFKIRGALNKVRRLGDAAEAGLVTASAGNHARALAQAARMRGVRCEVFMPIDAPASKVAAVERLGAVVRLEGASVDEGLALARELAAESGATLVHPFDDLDVIAGQGTLGLELADQVKDLSTVLVPLGGGGLASGLAIALQRRGVRAKVIGVQAQACAPYAESPGGVERARPTIADGIAIKRPGHFTLPLVEHLLYDVITVDEDQIADAMVFLAERCKLVSEGAGAVGVAALLAGLVTPDGHDTVAIVSGGNVDGGLLASLLRRRETEEGRRVRLFTYVPDRPGGLSELLALVAETRANLVTLEHVREAVELHVRETGVELTLETRGRAHTDSVVRSLKDAGYSVGLR
jgi:threonine dehydratase